MMHVGNGDKPNSPVSEMLRCLMGVAPSLKAWTKWQN